MKKFALFLCTLIIMIGLASGASATLFHEDYTGYQKVKKGSTYNFGADLWFDNSVYNIGTDSELGLTHDSFGAGAQGAYSSGTLVIDFYKMNKKKARNMDISFSALSSFGNATDFEIGFQWDRRNRQRKNYHFTYDLTSDQLALLDDTGWGNISVTSNRGRWGIQQVSIIVDAVDPSSRLGSVTPVPEPATMLLLGTGLLGIATFNRKRKKKWVIKTDLNLNQRFSK